MIQRQFIVGDDHARVGRRMRMAVKTYTKSASDLATRMGNKIRGGPAVMELPTSQFDDCDKGGGNGPTR